MKVSLLERLYQLDPLLGAQVRTRIENLCQRIEDLETQSDDRYEAIIERLIARLAAAQKENWPK